MITDDEALLCVSHNLQRLLGERGLSQSELARLTQETPMRISYYCRGLVMPGIGVSARIAEALDVSTDELLIHPKKRIRASAAIRG